jgi:predicted ATPase
LRCNISYYQKYGFEIRSLREFSNSLEDVRTFILGISAKLSNKPVLLLDGEAGIGKSHLIADIVKNRNAEGKPSLLFLGQHFVTDEDPWIQIYKKININCTLDEFLGALNSKAEITGSRLILFVDAMNEGRGRYFWGNNIRGFIKL